MNKLKLLFLAAGLAFASLAQAAPSHLPSGLEVGKPANGNVTALTPTTQARTYIPLSSILGGGGDVPLGVSVATGIYTGNATTLTNHAAVICPAVDGVTLTVSIMVPLNFEASGTLVLIVHSSATTALDDVSFTADVYTNTPDGLTSTAKAAGTKVGIAAGSSTTLQVVYLTNTNAVYTPGNLATWKITKHAGTVSRTEIVGAYFAYNPYGVIGQLPPQGPVWDAYAAGNGLQGASYGQLWYRDEALEREARLRTLGC